MRFLICRTAINLNPCIHNRLTMCAGLRLRLRVKPAMTEGVVAMTVQFVFSCLYAQKTLNLTTLGWQPADRNTLNRCL
ncbi:MAG: hypothetical protein LBH60_04160 [Prevotellaceae bacterium]|nr:hypothetical protein [Prevotellaceae bacterium]